MSQTRPTGEQLRFVSAATGEHILDDYLEASEKGGRTLPDLLDDLFTSGGDFNADLFEFRVNSTTKLLQVRVGIFSDPNDGWVDSNQYVFRNMGAWAAATAYKRLDTVLHSGNTYICTADHTSSGSAPGSDFQLALSSTVGQTHLLFTPDATYDIGASGASRPRAIYTSGAITAGGAITSVGSITAQASIVAQNGGHIRANSDAGTFTLGTSSDVILARDAANVLALRNGANAQALRLYNTYTDASNYERGGLTWTSNALRIGTERNGTGVTRAVNFVVGDIGVAWTLNTSGHLVAGTDATYDIGQSGASRPRNLYLSGQLVTGSHITMGSTSQISAAGAATMMSPSDGVWLMRNNAGTDFGRLQFGGTGSGFPSLKRSGTVLQGRLADDSNYCHIYAYGASTSEIRTGTLNYVAITPGDLYNALAEVTLTDAATISVDMSTFINAAVTLGGNRTLGNPTNPKVGQTGRIRIVQDATGSRTLSYGSNWKFAGGTAPTLTTTANAVDILEYEVITSTFIRASLTKGWA